MTPSQFAGSLGCVGAADVGAGEVVVLLRADDEQRVLRRDAVLREPVEELRERLVVALGVLDVAGVAGAECVAEAGGAGGRAVEAPVLALVDVGDVAVRHRNAGLLHGRELREALRGGRAEAREADVALEVGDLTVVEVDEVARVVRHPVRRRRVRVRGDERRDVLVAEQRPCTWRSRACSPAGACRSRAPVGVLAGGVAEAAVDGLADERAGRVRVRRRAGGASRRRWGCRRCSRAPCSRSRTRRPSSRPC